MSAKIYCEVIFATEGVATTINSLKNNIQGCLGLAKIKRDIVVRCRDDPAYRDLYEESWVTLYGTVEDEPITFDLNFPVFRRAYTHPDPETERAIQCRMDELMIAYQSMIARTRTELSCDPDLYDQFVLVLGGSSSQLMSVIDPEGSLRGCKGKYE